MPPSEHPRLIREMIAGHIFSAQQTKKLGVSEIFRSGQVCTFIAHCMRCNHGNDVKLRAAKLSGTRMVTATAWSKHGRNCLGWDKDDSFH
jgi:hypothetical protein